MKPEKKAIPPENGATRLDAKSLARLKKQQEAERNLMEARRESVWDEMNIQMHEAVKRVWIREGIWGDVIGEPDVTTNDSALSAGQRDRQTARCYAQGRWNADQTITITDMAEDIHGTIRFEGKPQYECSTIYDWIKDLAPNRKPGRRPKKT